MQPRLMLGILIAAAVTTPSAQAQDKYTIQLKKLGQGEAEVVEKTDVENNSLKLVDKDGKELKDLSLPKKETRLVYRETVLEKAANARLATKTKRQYDKAVITVEGKATPLPYQGKTVVIEKKTGEFRFTVEGGAELKGVDATLFQAEFNKIKEAEPEFEKVMLPRQAVAVGESWRMDRVAIIKGMKFGGDGLKIDEANVQGTGKLLKVYRQDGRQFGVMHMELVIPITASTGLDVEKGAKMVFSMDVDACIDGTATLGTFTVRLTISMHGRITGTENGVVSVTGGTLVEVHKSAR